MEIIQNIIKKGKPNRPAKSMKPTHITIHETGNYSSGADAKAHASYLQNTTAKVSWHYTVDENVAYQHVPDNEVAYHAGSTKGNNCSIGIEICVNKNGDFNRACENTISLVRMLMKKHKIPIDNVVQHNHWNGKNCPENLRVNGWNEFINKINQSEEIELTREELEQIVTSMIDQKSEKIYHFWKELPEWAYAPVKAMYDAGYFTGAGASNLNLSQTKMECIVIMAKALKKQGFLNY